MAPILTISPGIALLQPALVKSSRTHRSSNMPLLILVFILTAFVQPSLSDATGSTFLKRALAVAEHKALLRKNSEHPQLQHASRQSSFDSIPLCTAPVGERALERWEGCVGCWEQVHLSEIIDDAQFIPDTCPSGCCAEFSLQAIATAHIIYCTGGCCSRLVALQVVPDTPPEAAQLALELQVIVNNEYTVTDVGEFDRCELEQASVDGADCGPRCAYLHFDPSRCDGRTSVNVPVFGENMDPNNLPYTGPETPAAPVGGTSEGATEDSDPGQNDPTPTTDGGSVASVDAGGQEGPETPAAPVGVEGATEDSDPGQSDPTPTTDGGSVASVDAGGQETSGRDRRVCIDVRALRHLRPKDLVFEKGSLAHVLCDPNDSCSTPSHMVVFRGQAMMMRTYCDMVECSRRVLHVNSPRFTRRVRVPSNTNGLEFTAFAGRYETRTEEAFLSLVIRIGL